MAERKPTDNEERSAWNEGPWNEIAGILLMGLGFVVFLSLLSYSADDPSWNSTGANVRARNWIGPFGAIVADMLYQVFGLCALIWPIILILSGWWQWKDERPEVPKHKVLGIFLMIIAITGVLTMLGPKSASSYNPGGLVGYWLIYGPGIGLVHFLGLIGTIVALLIIFITGLITGTSFSFLEFMQNGEDDERSDRPPSLTDRMRNWKDERDTDRQKREANRHIIDKIDTNLQTRNRPIITRASLKTPPPVVKGRAKAQAEAAGSAGTGKQPAQPNPKIDGTPIIENIPINKRPERGGGEALSSGHVTPLLLDLPFDANTKIRGGSKKAKVEADDDSLEYLDGNFDYPDSEASPVSKASATAASKSANRVVDEMTATASVSQTKPEEEKPTAKSKSAKLKDAVSRILGNYKLPTTEMLSPPSPRSEMEETELLDRARQLAEKCAEFNVAGQVKQISPGPVVTTFEFKPDPGVKYSRVTSLVDDLCLGMKAESIRIDRIPGKSTVGIEVPNTNRETIRLREVIESKKFRESKSYLTLALGKTIDGSNYVADLAKMPHLLIAGATGAGKSVMLNAVLVSLLYKADPMKVKLILVDPKRLELGLYTDLPHLLTPIVTDAKRAGYALKWAVAEMEGRYKHLAAFGVRNIEQYNSDVCGGHERKKPLAGGDGTDVTDEKPQALPYIVVIIDELADLMMVAARDVEESITRLAQMARAVGIHLVLATQRPSVDVITGLIKANFPSRISFRVSSKVDSRTIIDTNGAEQLLGQGDMLFLPPGTSRLIRVHGAYVDEKEVKRICDYIRSMAKPDYDEKVVMSEKEAGGGDESDLAKDEKYDDAVRIIIQSGKASTSLLQRHLRIGYGRAASIIDMMYREGIVGPEDGTKPRQVLVKEDFLERLNQIRDF